MKKQLLMVAVLLGMVLSSVGCIVVPGGGPGGGGGHHHDHHWRSSHWDGDRGGHGHRW